MKYVVALKKKKVLLLIFPLNVGDVNANSRELGRHRKNKNASRQLRLEKRRPSSITSLFPRSRNKWRRQPRRGDRVVVPARRRRTSRLRPDLPGR
jgi:hypothetical protein